MGTVGATQLCWVILSFLLLQGHNSQPTTQPPVPQGTFSSFGLTIESTSSNTGNSLSSEPITSSPLSSTSTPAPEASETTAVASEPMMSRSSTVDGQASSLSGLTQPEPQKHTSGLGTGVPSSGSGGGGSTSAATMSLRIKEELTILPSPTSETVLTVAAFGVISFIVILVVVVIVLVSVVSLRFKCQKNKESEDPQKPGNSGISESCSTANGEKDSITLISMKNINMNNSKGCPSTEKVL